MTKKELEQLRGINLSLERDIERLEELQSALCGSTRPLADCRISARCKTERVCMFRSSTSCVSKSSNGYAKALHYM